MPKINLKDVPEDGQGEFTPVPAGVYKVKVSHAVHEKEDSKEYIKATFKVTSGEHEGSIVNNWFHLAHPEAKRISMDQLKLLGVPSNFHPANAHTLVGLECQIVTTLTDDGKYANVKRIAQKEIPTGSYDAVVHSVERRDWNGKDFLEVTYRITDGDYKDFYLSDNLYLHDKALGFTASRLKRLGASMDEFDTDNITHVNSLVGSKVRVSTSSEITTAGLVYNKITSITKTEINADEPEPGVIRINTSAVAGIPSENRHEEFDEGFGTSEEPF